MIVAQIQMGRTLRVVMRVWRWVTLLVGGLTCCSHVDDGRCKELRHFAASLVEEFAECDQDEDCQVVDLRRVFDRACILDLQCAAALNDRQSMDAFVRRGQELNDRYNQDCTTCYEAFCSSSESLAARCTGTLCELVPAN